MSTIVMGKGRLHHHFWGEYRCSVYLEFPDAESARDAAVSLYTHTAGLWKQGPESDADVLGIFLDSESLELLKAKLEPWLQPVPCNRFGCRDAMHPIDGLEHSVDLGAPFDVLIPIVPAEQLALPLEVPYA